MGATVTATLDVEFDSGGCTLRGWLLVPTGAGPHPALVVTNGFGSVKELFLDHPYHEVFAAAGFAVLVYDHPNCGESDGQPREELDPIAQQRATATPSPPCASAMTSTVSGSASGGRATRAATCSPSPPWTGASGASSRRRRR